MTQFLNVNVKLSDLQLKKIEISNKKYYWSNLSSNVFGTSKADFPHKLLLTDR